MKRTTPDSRTNQRPSRPSVLLALGVVFSLFAATLSIFASTSVVAAQSDDFGTAELTPTTALVYIRGNLHTDSDQWTLANELFERSGIAEATGEDVSLEDVKDVEPSVDGEVAFVLTSINAGEDVDFSEVTNIASDPMSSMGSDIPSGFSVLYQPDDIEGVTEELRSSIENSETEVETSEYGGVTIEYAPPADEYSDGYAFAQINDETLAIATLPSDLEPIIDTANGDLDPLSANENFTSFQDALTTDSIAFGYVDGSALIDQVLAISPEVEAEVPEATIASARAYVGFSFWADDPGFRIDTLVMPADGGELPALSNFQPTLADRVSADSLLFATGQDLGPSGALDAIGLILAQAIAGEEPLATPAANQDADAYADQIFAEAERTLGFNIKTDLIDQLVDEYAMSVSVKNIDSAVPDIDAIFVSGADDPTTVNDVVSKISFLVSAGAPEDTVSSRDLADGTSLYQFNVGDESFPMVIEVGVIDDQLVIGLNNGIDEYVDGPETALSDDPNYDAVFSNLPDEFSSAVFVNIPKVVPVIESFASSMSASSTPDNNPACGDYDTQEEAQAEYDENFDFDLDQDFDGEACEDFFNPATPGASSPESATSALNILGIGSVTVASDGNIEQNTLIAIGD